MDALGIPFEVIPADIDEKSIRSDDLAIQAEAIARAKAEKVASENEGIVIAGDAFVEVNGEVFEKPENIEEAKNMLRQTQGNIVKVYSGLCYIDRHNSIDFANCVVPEATFREMSEDEIEAYVTAFPVLTWSGAYSPAYTYGTSMIAELHGSFTGFTVGLAMEHVIPLLRQSGFDPRPTQ